MTNFDVTISYKAIINVNINANSEEEAKEKALLYFINKERKKWYETKQVSLTDDSFKVSGILNMDETWNQF